MRSSRTIIGCISTLALNFWNSGSIIWGIMSAESIFTTKNMVLLPLLGPICGFCLYIIYILLNISQKARVFYYIISSFCRDLDIKKESHQFCWRMESLIDFSWCLWQLRKTHKWHDIYISKLSYFKVLISYIVQQYLTNQL